MRLQGNQAIVLQKKKGLIINQSRLLRKVKAQLQTNDDKRSFHESFETVMKELYLVL